MRISVTEAQTLWDKFLKRWPLEDLPKITLAEYTKAGDTDCFTYGWLEQTTEDLGSIWGGSAFKFGVYSRKDQSQKSGGAGRSYSTEYGWYNKYGTSPEKAFDRVRTIIYQVACAARAGDLMTVEKADLGTVIKWKIAFLYQDQEHPVILPVYSADHLAAYLEQKSKRNMANLQSAAMAKRGDIDVYTFGQTIWDIAQTKLAAMTLKPEDALAYFEENPERFQAIKAPNEKIGGFMTTDGRQLALALDTRKTKLWLEPGPWIEAVKGQLREIEQYPPERTRSSNLPANAPKLAEGNPAVYVTVPTHAALLALCDAYDTTEPPNHSAMPTNIDSKSSDSPLLNQILYGPPGTGKTFATIDEALRILDPEFLQIHALDRGKLKGRFDQFLAQGAVRFITFHQSSSYEDFVEGLRVTINDATKQPEYIVESGVFKRLCDDARTQDAPSGVGISTNPRIWKISINGSGESSTKTYCLNHGEARLGWGKTGDLREPFTPNSYYQSLGSSDQGTLEYFSKEVQPGDILLCLHSVNQFEAVGVVTGEYRYEGSVPSGVIADYQHVLPVNWIYKGLKLSILPLNDNTRFTLKSVYPLSRITWGDLLPYIQKSGVPSTEVSGGLATSRKPHVLIIDEINRGNISRIFGELITLIEPTKRDGATEALSVILPYSKKPFSVPSNVYLIGTMNTADRSLAGLDIALRRRFTFREMAPKPELLDDVTVDGVNIGQLLRKMNERIEILLDRDHRLGHAYFMPLKEEKGEPFEKLKSIFRQQILPLLQEYFFEDWERIAWVLNDHAKPESHAFVLKAQTNLIQLFGPAVAENLQNVDRRWRLNESAFGNIESYRDILGVSA